MEYSIDIGTQQQDITVVDDEVEQHQRDSTIIVASIKEMMQKLPPITPECSIYRVSNRLRSNNPVAYTPQAISIGPFHHGKEDLMAMEPLKLQFLDGYLCRINMGVEAAFEIAQKWESKARNCYAESIKMNSNEFVKMLLVDGCFIVEIMIINDPELHETSKKLSPSFCNAITVDLSPDLILLDNQLPFFVLKGLFNQFSQDISFVQIAQRFLTSWFRFGPSCQLPPTACESTRELNHLVDLFSLIYYANPSDKDPVTTRKNQEFNIEHPTGTELWEAGVKFQKPKEKHIMDISFHDGVLEIPPFEISDVFETIMRNLMAFEHYHVVSNKRYATQYALFMDELIDTEKDVSLLVKANIITNSIGGSHEEISKLFNDLCKDIPVSFDSYYYDKISAALRGHCSARWNKWKTLLKRDYFNTPWAFISFFAATVLILFTVLQFIFTVLQGSK